MLEKIKNFATRLKNHRREKPFIAWPLQLAGAAFFLGLFFILSLCLLIRLGAFGALPSKADLKNIQNDNSSEVYGIDGELLGKYFIVNRTTVSYDQISPHLINALIATEDARFFDHGGIDLRAWARVLIKTVMLSDESGGGGSTLSQQLAKNLFPRKRHRLLAVPINKIKEMYVARRLEKIYSKDELLNLYLNTVPFGGNIYGVQVAANTYFNTTAKDVKIEEAAVLVGMLKANTYYNPVRNPESAKGRRNVVLSQMKRYGYLEAAEVDSLKNVELEVDYHRDSNNEGLATYFREHLRKKLETIVENKTKPDGSPYNLYTDGLKINTTIHSRMQQYAEEAVQKHLKKLQGDFDKHWKGRKPWGSDKVLEKEMQKSHRYRKMKEEGYSAEEIKTAFDKKVKMTVFSYEGDVVKELSPLDSLKYYYCLLNAGFLAMDPSNGQVRAWVGGIDHKYFKYDHVKSRRQVGSTFKPLVYTTALRQGIPPCGYINNRLVVYTDYEDWTPENSDGDYGGVYSMAGALRNSVNSVAVDLIMQTSVDSVRELAQMMGVSGTVPQAPAIALGAVDAALYDMVQVYGTYANRGLKAEPQYLLRIENSEGEVLVEFEPLGAPEQVIRRQEADIMTKMMEGVVDSGTARRLRFTYKLPNAIAGKTGTTQSHADGWFMGYTPHIVAGAWVGGESPQVRFRSIKLGQGANTALPIWAEFMKRLNKDKEYRKWANAVFPVPSVEVLAAMDCDPYLEEAPVILVAEDSLELEKEFFEKFDDLLGSFGKKKKKKKERVNVPPGGADRRKQQTEAQEKESKRIKKKNERLRKKKERKKKRQEKLDKLFKRDG